MVNDAPADDRNAESSLVKKRTSSSSELIHLASSSLSLISSSSLSRTSLPRSACNRMISLNERVPRTAEVGVRPLSVADPSARAKVRRSGVMGGLGGLDTSDRERFQSSLAPVEEATEVMESEESERSMRGDSAGDMSARA